MTVVEPPTIASITRRYLVLEGLRWLPTGLLIPVVVLLFTSRGFSLTEFGIFGTVMAVTTFVLELPTGGLADTLGRKRVLLVAGGFLLVAKAGLVMIARSPTRPPWVVVLVSAITLGVYRALESGPLGAWYVDALHATDPDADVEAGLGRAGMVTGLSIATGSLSAGAIIALDPLPGVDPMAVVLWVSFGLAVMQLVALVVLLDERRPGAGDAWSWADSVRAVPATVAETLGLVRTSQVLALLLLVEVSWATGMVAFENLFPVRLADLTGSTDDAAALLGPVGAAAWAASAGGAAVVVRLSRRLGPYRTGALLRVVQATCIAGMVVAGGATGLVVAFVATYLAHGASGPVHLTLLHRQVTADHRATALSLNSMVGFATFSVAGIAVGAVADGSGVITAMGVCAAATVVGAVGYLLARSRDPGGGRGRVGADDAATPLVPSR